jgi:hypothetical protein
LRLAPNHLFFSGLFHFINEIRHKTTSQLRGASFFARSLPLINRSDGKSSGNQTSCVFSVETFFTGIENT